MIKIENPENLKATLKRRSDGYNLDTGVINLDSKQAYAKDNASGYILYNFSKRGDYDLVLEYDKDLKIINPKNLRATVRRKSDNKIFEAGIVEIHSKQAYAKDLDNRSRTSWVNFSKRGDFDLVLEYEEC